MSAQLRVIITDCPWEDDSIERGILEAGGAQVTRVQCKTPQDVISAAQGADALLVGWAPITREVIKTFDRCRLLMRYGTGYDAITDESFKEIYRLLPALQDSIRNGGWDPLKVLLPFPPLAAQIVGIVGFGRIGRYLAGLVRPLAKHVLVHDPWISDPAMASKAGVELVKFDELLSQSDYISIHVPLTAETRAMFGRQALFRMKKGSYLINCARGPIVDECALVESLREGRLAGAALDVFSEEPLPVDHPLHSFPRVLLTPHAAWYSTQSDYRLRANPAENILRFFRGEPMSLLNP